MPRPFSWPATSISLSKSRGIQLAVARRIECGPAAPAMPAQSRTSRPAWRGRPSPRRASGSALGWDQTSNRDARRSRAGADPARHQAEPLRAGRRGRIGDARELPMGELKNYTAFKDRMVKRPASCKSTLQYFSSSSGIGTPVTAQRTNAPGRTTRKSPSRYLTSASPAMGEERMLWRKGHYRPQSVLRARKMLTTP